MTKLADDVVLIAAADTHVDEHAWADRREICGDSQAAFQWLVDLAVENDKPLALAGDVLERQSNEAAVAAFLRAQLARLTQPLFFIQGQHDRQPRPWLSALADSPARVVWLAEAPLGQGYDCLQGLRIHGIDWSPTEELPAQLARVPAGTDLLLMHQVCDGFMGTIRLPELSLAQVPHVPLLVVGDYHKQLVRRVTGASGQALTAISPGSTNLRAINEPAEKYAICIQRDLSFFPIRIPSRPVLRTELPAEPLLDEFVEKIAVELETLAARAVAAGLPPAIQKPLLHVRFNPAVPDAYRRIRQAVGDAAHLFTQTHVPGELEVDPLVDAAETAPTESPYAVATEGALACLPECVSEAADPVVFALCRRLLTETDPQAVLAEVRQQYFGD